MAEQLELTHLLREVTALEASEAAEVAVEEASAEAVVEATVEVSEVETTTTLREAKTRLSSFN